ncbi:MAG: hypothetical protein HY822_21885 [Acidobacteria bacterium]|nr:hypothetical protein [Acidobacteriota bacterium]
MDEAGQRLKRVRERLNLRYRDVEEASQRIAERHKNDEFTIVLSRLADIENKGAVPNIYRLHSLCAIYRLDILEVLEWYGVNVSEIPSDSTLVEVSRTHEVGFTTTGHGAVQVPLALDPGIDLRRTTFLSRAIQRWGRLPLMLLNSVDLRNHRYAFIGTEDWSMYPILHPGSLVLIDETRRKIAETGWTSEFERPIYLLETREEWLCGWCSQSNDQLVVHPHPASECAPRAFAYPREVDVIGQVTGVATRLGLARRRRTRA